MSRTLVPLPPHPGGVPWPTHRWERAVAPSSWGLDAAVNEMLGNRETFGDTYAVAVAHRGALVGEWYPDDRSTGAEDGTDGRDGADGGPDAGPGRALLSWSVAKSVLHAAVGMLVGDGLLTLEGPAGVAAWSSPDDPRGAITLDDLLAMRDGLDFVEEYDPTSERSDVIEMLFGAGQHDVAAFAADRPLAAPPGTRYSYSSGTSNIVSGLVADRVGRGAAYERWLHDRIFGVLGMASARPGLDPAGTWVASSYLHATAQDWLRFGEWYLRDGVWEDRRLLPAGWVDQGRLPRSLDEDGSWYGHHWWTSGDPYGTFWATGYEGQTVTICPAFDLVVVRFGRTIDGGPALTGWRQRLIQAVAAAQ